MKKSLSKILARMAKDGDIETVSEIIEEMLDPEEPLADECEEDPKPEVSASSDALRAALTAIRPALKGMSRAGRRKVCADIAARLNRQRAADSRKYAALLSTRKHAARDHADLGRRIMAKRNPNYHAS